MAIGIILRSLGVQWLTFIVIQNKSHLQSTTRVSEWSSPSWSFKDRRCLRRKLRPQNCRVKILKLIDYQRPVATFQSYFQRLVKSVRNPSQLFNQASNTAANTNPQTVLQRIRNINSSQLAYGGVIFAECLGFFTVGEMIGRMKLVGYRGDTGVHH